jgi:plastocyanin
MKHMLAVPVAWRRWLTFIAMAAVASLATVGSVSAGPARTVQIAGEEQFVPNAMIMATLRFQPGPISVDNGDTVTWTNNTDEPHTITIVDAADIPTNIEEVFGCTAPGGPCFPALAGHFGTTPPTIVLGGGADGTAGLDGVGDSLLVFPGGEISASVTAPTGTTLNYLCAIHPWMIGSIDVR